MKRIPKEVSDSADLSQRGESIMARSRFNLNGTLTRHLQDAVHFVMQEMQIAGPPNRQRSTLLFFDAYAKISDTQANWGKWTKRKALQTLQTTAEGLRDAEECENTELAYYTSLALAYTIVQELIAQTVPSVKDEIEQIAHESGCKAITRILDETLA